MNDQHRPSERPGAGKRAEDALRREQTMLARTEGIANIGSWEWEIATDTVTWSNELFRIFQRDPGEGAPSFAEHSALYHPDDMVRLQKAVEAAIALGTPYELELQAIRKDGETRACVARGVAEMAPGGRAVRLFGSLQDITERKRVEEALRGSEEKYRLLMEKMLDGVYRSSHEGRFLEVNPALVKMLGYDSKEELQAIDIKSRLYFVPEERESTVSDEKHEEMSVFRLRKKDGSQIWVEAHGRQVFDGEGAVLYHEGVLRDITERKKAEEELRESEEDYGTLFREMLNGFALHEIICDEAGYPADYRFLAVNPAFERMTGLKVEEIVGKTVLEVMPGTERHWIETYGKVALTGQPAFFENYSAEIGKNFEVTAFRPAPNQFACFFADITERKQLEERIRQVRTDLLFAVSHDLKSPLQALHQSQEMLSALQPGEGLARFQAYSEIWRRNLQRLERMINNLLDSQRSEEGRFPLLLAPSNPAEMVKRVVEDSQGYALSSQVSFDLKLQPVPHGACDEEALSRAVENLLTNAVKFSPKGGKVEVRLKLEGDTLLLEVEDHGLGIPANEQAQLFQPFQRGSSAQQRKIPGTGLGLYVSRRIVEEHGGSITLASEEGKGTVVTVRLPWGKV